MASTSSTGVEEEPDITVVSATVPDAHVEATDVGRKRVARTLHPVVLGLVASVPLIVGAVIDAAHGWIPYGDDATIVLRARDVFSGHMPLVGQYSELSWYGPHATFAPGPMLYWLLAIPAQTTRWFPAAPLLWMALFQSIVVIAVVCLANRLGGAVLAVGVAFGFVLLAGSLGPRPFYDPWSAYAPILPLVLLAFLTAAVVSGRWRLLPLVALVAIFEVQADPSFAIVTVALVLLAVGGWIVDRRRARSAGWTTLGLTAAVVAVCWLPSIVQQFTTSPGNFTNLWHGVQAQGHREGLGFGLTILGKAIGGWPFNRWVDLNLRSGAPVSMIWIAVGLLVLAVLVGLVVSAIRAHERNMTALALTSLTLSLAVAIAASQIPNDHAGHVSFWLLTWTHAAGMVVWAVVAWSAWQLFSERIPQRSFALGATTLLLIGSVGVAVFGRLPDPASWAYPTIRRASAVIERRPGNGPYVISAAMWPPVPLLVGQGVLQQLDAHGYKVGVNNGFEHNAGLHYRLPRGTPDVIVTGDPDRNGRVSRPFGAQPLLTMPVDLWENGRRVVVQVSLRE